MPRDGQSYVRIDLNFRSNLLARFGTDGYTPNELAPASLDNASAACADTACKRIALTIRAKWLRPTQIAGALVCLTHGTNLRRRLTANFARLLIRA
jgi:hypothetical protein